MSDSALNTKSHPWVPKFQPPIDIRVFSSVLLEIGRFQCKCNSPGKVMSSADHPLIPHLSSPRPALLPIYALVLGAKLSIRARYPLTGASPVAGQ